MSKETRDIWAERAKDFVPRIMDEDPVLGKFRDRASVIFHGSTMLGVDDAGSDLDFWILLPEKDMKELDAMSATRFFEMDAEGKPGHLNAESAESFTDRVRRCDLALIRELRTASVSLDCGGVGAKLLAEAAKPMRPEVSRAFFFHHYVEMRGEHRSCDNPMNRAQPAGVLFSLPKALSHALKAAIALDGEPYAYEKWLYQAALETPTGSAVAEGAEMIIDHLAFDCLRLNLPEPQNPLSQELRKIRRILVDAAKAKGIDEPWLDKWYLHIDQARDVLKSVRW